MYSQATIVSSATAVLDMIIDSSIGPFPNLIFHFLTPPLTMADMKLINDQQPLQRVPDSKRHILNELVETERSYARHLTVMLTYFRDHFKELVGSAEQIVAAPFVKIVFTSIPELRDYSLQIAVDLEKALKLWEMDEDESVGAIFVKRRQDWSIYKKFVDNYAIAMNQIRDAQRKNTAFTEYCAKARASKETDRQDLTDYMILPIQRILRYSLLLKDLRKKTPVSHFDYNDLSNAYDEMNELSTQLNNVKLKEEETTRMFECERVVEGFPPQIISASRRLIIDGDGMSPSLQKAHMHIVIFSDVLLYARHKQQKSMFKFSNSAPETKKYKFEKLIYIQDITRVLLDSQDGIFLIYVDKMLLKVFGFMPDKSPENIKKSEELFLDLLMEKDVGGQLEQVLKSRLKEYRRVSTLEQRPQFEIVKLSKLNGGDIIDLDETSSVESTTSTQKDGVGQVLAGYLFKSKSKSQETKKDDLLTRSQSLTSNSKTSTLSVKKDQLTPKSQ